MDAHWVMKGQSVDGNNEKKDSKKGSKKGGERGDSGRRQGDGTNSPKPWKRDKQLVVLPLETSTDEELLAMIRAGATTLLVQRKDVSSNFFDGDDDGDGDGENNEDDVTAGDAGSSFTLIPRERRDWLDERKGRCPSKSYWPTLNLRLGNMDSSLEGVLLVTQRAGIDATQIDVKGAEIYSGVVINHINDGAKWARFCRNLEGASRLENGHPLCSKLRHLCAARSDRVFVVVKACGKMDLLGGKPTLEEYARYAAQRDHAVLLEAALRETLEELNVILVGGAKASSVHIERTDERWSCLRTPVLQCVRVDDQGELAVGVQLVQLAPFLFKAVIT